VAYLHVDCSNDVRLFWSVSMRIRSMYSEGICLWWRPGLLRQQRWSLLHFRSVKTIKGHPHYTRSVEATLDLEIYRV